MAVVMAVVGGRLLESGAPLLPPRLQINQAINQNSPQNQNQNQNKNNISNQNRPIKEQESPGTK